MSFSRAAKLQAKGITLAQVGGKPDRENKRRRQSKRAMAMDLQRRSEKVYEEALIMEKMYIQGIDRALQTFQTPNLDEVIPKYQGPLLSRRSRLKIEEFFELALLMARNAVPIRRKSRSDKCTRKIDASERFESLPEYIIEFLNKPNAKNHASDAKTVSATDATGESILKISEVQNTV